MGGFPIGTVDFADDDQRPPYAPLNCACCDREWTESTFCTECEPLCDDGDATFAIAFGCALAQFVRRCEVGRLVAVALESADDLAFFPEGSAPRTRARHAAAVAALAEMAMGGGGGKLPPPESAP